MSYGDHGFEGTGHLWLLSKTSFLTWCISTYYAHNNKPVNILTQLVKMQEIDEKKNTLVAHICVLSDENKRLQLKSFII